MLKKNRHSEVYEWIFQHASFTVLYLDFLQPSTSHCCAYKLPVKHVSCCPHYFKQSRLCTDMRTLIPVSTIYSELNLYKCVLNFSVSSAFILYFSCVLTWQQGSTQLHKKCPSLCEKELYIELCVS